MGRRGPAPKPTHLKLIADNPGKYPLNRREPAPRRGTPRCPQWLRGEGKAEWRWVTQELRAMGLLAIADKHAVAVYCQTLARWRAAEEFIAKHGEAYPVRDAAGRLRFMQPFPQAATARNLVSVLKAYQQELGMTPSARSRIQLEIPSGVDSEKARRYFNDP